MMDMRLQAVGGKSTPHSATAIRNAGNVDDFCNITKTINNSKQCDHVWKVRPHPTLVVCSRPRIAGHDTSVPAVAPFKTRRIEDQVSPFVDSALDGVKQEQVQWWWWMGNMDRL